MYLTLILYHLEHSSLLPLLNCNLQLQQWQIWLSPPAINLLNCSIKVYMYVFRTVNPHFHEQQVFLKLWVWEVLSVGSSRELCKSWAGSSGHLKYILLPTKHPHFCFEVSLLLSLSQAHCDNLLIALLLASALVSAPWNSLFILPPEGSKWNANPPFPD